MKFLLQIPLLLSCLFASPTFSAQSFETPHVKNWEASSTSHLLDVIDYIEELYNYQHAQNPNEVHAGISNYQNLLAFIADARQNPYNWMDQKLALRMNLIRCFDLLGVYERYQYSLDDLISRRKATGSFKTAILQKESEGKAVALSNHDAYLQYTNRFDTESAFFLGFEYMQMYVDVLFEPVMLATAVQKFSKLSKGYKQFKGFKCSAGVKMSGAGGGFGVYSTSIDNSVSVIQKENLFGNDAFTFLDAEYRTVQSIEQVTTYRSFGGNAKVGGTFVTTKSGATRTELALLDEWNNSMRFEATINIPPGTKMNIGRVGPQTSTDGLQTLSGGGDQVILPYQWNTEWVSQIVDKNTGKIYNSLSEFAQDFPQLVN